MIDLDEPDYGSLIGLFDEGLCRLRDIYVTGVDEWTWDELLAGLVHSPWAAELQRGGRPVEFVPAVEIMAARSSGSVTYSLRVTVGNAWLWCHFFEADEIEFSFSVTQISSASDVAWIVAFMDWLSDVLGRDVKLTLEAPGGDSAPPVLLVQKDADRLRVFPV